MPPEQGSDLLRYLAERGHAAGERLPPLQDLATELGLSVGKLREQLEVARELALVEVRPKTGIRTLGYSFTPAVWASLRFALGLDPAHFEHFETLRNHVERSFFLEAVGLLQPEDKQHLQDLIARAWQRLRGEPVQIPHAEHRELHLTMYARLQNPFVRGVLEAYWEAYESVGLDVYADYSFLHEVWTYHEAIVAAILRGETEQARQLLIEHTALVVRRPRSPRPRPAAQPEPALRDPARAPTGVT